jgi:hypothetical protein
MDTDERMMKSAERKNGVARESRRSRNASQYRCRQGEWTRKNSEKRNHQTFRIFRVFRGQNLLTLKDYCARKYSELSEELNAALGLAH